MDSSCAKQGNKLKVMNSCNIWEKEKKKKHVNIKDKLLQVTSSWVKKPITSQVLILFAIFPTFTLVRIVQSSGRRIGTRIVGWSDHWTQALGPRSSCAPICLRGEQGCPAAALRRAVATWHSHLQFDLHGSVENSGKVCNPLLQPKYR